MSFQDGDIILVKVNHFTAWYRWLLAKLIQFFDGVYYHHAQIVYDGIIWEASTQVVARAPEFNDGDEVLILRLKRPLDKLERGRFHYTLNDLCGRKYDYWGVMLHQLVYILTFRRIWIGKSGGKAIERPYCTELVTGIMHRLRGYFPEHYKIGPSRLIQHAALYYDVVFEGVYKHR